MKKKNLIFTLLTLVLSIGLLVVTTLAWFSSRPSTIEPVIVTTGNLSVEATLETQWNGTASTWTEVTTAVNFADRLPGDELFFKLTVENTGTVQGQLYVDVRNIVYSAGTDGFDWSYNPATEQVVETVNNQYDFSSRLLFKNHAVGGDPEFFDFAIDGTSLYDNIAEYDATNSKDHIVLISATDSVVIAAGATRVFIFSVRFAENGTVLPFEFGETNNVYQSFPESALGAADGGRPNAAYSTETNFNVSFNFKQFFIELNQVQ